MAGQLIERRAGPFEPAPDGDASQQALRARLEAKIAGRAIVPALAPGAAPARGRAG